MQRDKDYDDKQLVSLNVIGAEQDVYYRDVFYLVAMFVL